MPELQIYQQEILNLSKFEKVFEMNVNKSSENGLITVQLPSKRE